MTTITGKAVKTSAVTGDMLRDQGVLNILAADCAPHRRAAPAIREVVEAYADSGQFFTAEDVREALRENSHVIAEMRRRPNLLPAVMQAASQRGRVQPVAWVTAHRPEAHGRGLRVWQGVAA